jgi:hypothetical protein
MKTIQSGILVAVISLFSFCGNKTTSDGKKSTSDQGLNGTWEVVKAEGMMAEANVGTLYIFEKGTLSFSKDGYDNKANSVQTDSTFTWDNGNMTMEYRYTFDNNTLVARPKGSDQVLYLEKK